VHDHESIRLAAQDQAQGDLPRQTFVTIDLRHEHGAVADSEEHEHTVELGIDVDGRIVHLYRHREGG
jgi:hypothetical protein